jgi:hypothetical protein
MGATSSNTKQCSNKFNSNIYSTPPKLTKSGIHNRLFQLQCDPRSPTGKKDTNKFIINFSLSFI